MGVILKLPAPSIKTPIDLNLFLAVLFTEFMEAQAIEKTAQVLAVLRRDRTAFLP